jgi:alpha-glucosidase (family GH31 glycosyl hydrolase)
MREACDTGLPPMRAMWLHYPKDGTAVKLGDQYLWGRDLLIAPVVEKGATTRKVYLPAGLWYDWWSGEKLSGAGHIQRTVDLATMPIFARAGAIVPLDPVRQHTGQVVTEPTTIRVYRGADGQYLLYDDDGNSLQYLKGQGTWTKFTWLDRQRRLVIEQDARSGMQSGQERAFEVLILPEGKRQRVNYTGKRLELEF